MSNPSVPLDSPAAGGHSVPTEVDATTGNPGVPVDEAGRTGVPVEVDATPHPVELDGVRNWAGGGTISPGPQQPVEMGHHWRE